MTSTPFQTLDGDLRAEFEQLRLDLAAAVLRNRQKDNAYSRNVIAACQTKLDAVLDMYLDLGCVPEQRA